MSVTLIVVILLVLILLGGVGYPTTRGYIANPGGIIVLVLVICLIIYLLQRL